MVVTVIFFPGDLNIFLHAERPLGQNHVRDGGSCLCHIIITWNRSIQVMDTYLPGANIISKETGGHAIAFLLQKLESTKCLVGSWASL